jgi:hypothetical protein
MRSQIFPDNFVLVGGFPDEPEPSDVDAICSSPGPISFFEELFLAECGLVLPRGEIREENRTDDELRIRAWSGTPAIGLERVEKRCLETSFVPVNIECITHGLRAMEVHWKFALEHAGQFGHAAFSHVSLSARIGDEPALKQFREVWLKVFNREPVLQPRNLDQQRLS